MRVLKNPVQSVALEEKPSGRVKRRRDTLAAIAAFCVLSGGLALSTWDLDSFGFSGCKKGSVIKPSSAIEAKLEAWKSDLRLGLCGENHRKVLFEIRAEEGRLMGTGNEDDMKILINFENAVMASQDAKRKIPECSR